MHVNELALAYISTKREAAIEGRLSWKNVRSKSRSSFRDKGFQEKWFRLIGNMLFYFPLDNFGAIKEEQPVGVYILENCSVHQESYSELPFAFCVVFNSDPDCKLLFGCCSQIHCQEWVKFLKQASYEYYRKQMITLRRKLQTMTGEDPLPAEPVPGTSVAKSKSTKSVKAFRGSVGPKVSSFHSHVPSPSRGSFFSRLTSSKSIENLLKF